MGGSNVARPSVVFPLSDLGIHLTVGESKRRCPLSHTTCRLSGFLYHDNVSVSIYLIIIKGYTNHVKVGVKYIIRSKAGNFVLIGLH